MRLFTFSVFVFLKVLLQKQHSAVHDEWIKNLEGQSLANIHLDNVGGDLGLDGNQSIAHTNTGESNNTPTDAGETLREVAVADVSPTNVNNSTRKLEWVEGRAGIASWFRSCLTGSILEVDRHVGSERKQKIKKLMFACAFFTAFLVLLLMVVRSGISEADQDQDVADDTESDREPEVLSQTVLATWADTKWLDQAAAGKVAPKRCTHPVVDLIEPEWTLSSLSALLARRHVPAGSWEDAALTNVARELTEKKARLGLADGELIRIVEMVVVLVVHEQGEMVLMELSPPSYKRKFSTIEERTLKTRWLTGEAFDVAVRRCLAKTLPVVDGFFEKWACISIKEKLEKYDHMKGLKSLIRKHVVRCSVKASNPEQLELLGLKSGRLQGVGNIYRWESIHDVPNFRKCVDQLLHPRRNVMQVHDLTQMLQPVPALLSPIEPCLPWTSASVTECLEKRSVTTKTESLMRTLSKKDISTLAFGFPTMKELVQALQKGKIGLGVRRDTSEVVCVVDVVSITIRSNNGVCLATKELSRLPCVQRWPDESVWMAVPRITRDMFNISESLFCLEDTLDECEVPDTFLAEIGMENENAPSLICRGFNVAGCINVDLGSSYSFA